MVESAVRTDGDTVTATGRVVGFDWGSVTFDGDIPISTSKTENLVKLDGLEGTGIYDKFLMTLTNDPIECRDLVGKRIEVTFDIWSDGQISRSFSIIAEG